jgi:hypothetical protein
MSGKSEMERTVPENLLRPQGFNEEAIRNFQLSIAKGTATEVEFVGGKLRLVYRS